jgi:ribonuclease-3
VNDLRFFLSLINILGFIPIRLSLYRMAFMPRALARKQLKGGAVNNERLEYLGDAVLDAIVADFLFRKYPGGDEGFMSQVRSRIVKRKTLDQLALQVGIPGMIPTPVHPSDKSKHLYGNALEALVGAIYLDRGYRKAKRFFIRRILNKHEDLDQLIRKDPDHKSRLIEWAQKHRVEVRFETGVQGGSASTSPTFTSSLYLNGENRGNGRGNSKKEAEQRAAREALSLLDRG